MGLKDVLTHLQLFGIGFSFGIAGPCFLTCTPVLLTYVTGSRKSLRDCLADIFIFLSGRLAAYLILGCLAGISGVLIRQLATERLALLFRPIGGLVSIFMGVLVLATGWQESLACRIAKGRLTNFAGVLALGFAVGVSPCGPLAALLFEIALMSKNAFQGASYALSFGLGTFLSGMIVVGASAGILTWVPSRLLKSKAGNKIFKALCGLLLILLGLTLIIR